MKKFISLLLCLSILCGLTYIVQASEIDFDETYSDIISESQTENKYSFTLYNSGNLQIKFSAEDIEKVSLKLYDANGQQIWESNPYWNSTSKQISFLENVMINSGTYSFFISKYFGYGTYEFELSFNETGESFNEPQDGSNNTFKTASQIELNDNYVGQISVNDEVDNYAFTMDNSGSIDLSLSAENIEKISLKFYDANGQEIWGSSPYWNSTSKQISFSEGITLTSGIYYFAVSKYYGYGTYEFELSFEETGESFGETQDGDNNTFKTASQIETDNNYVAQIAINDEIDNYVFTLDNSGSIGLSLGAESIEKISLKFYDANGQQIWESNPYWNSTSKQISFSEDIALTSGTYYFTVSKYYGYGTYKFKLSFDEAGESFEEVQGGDNNTFKTANQIELNNNYYGQIAINDEVDNYAFTLDNSGSIDLSLSAENIEKISLKIYDASGQEIWGSSPYWNDTSKQISFSESITLTSGTYYLAISKYYGYGTYKFKLSTHKDIVFDSGNNDNDDSNSNTDYDSSDNTGYADDSDIAITSFDSTVSKWAKEEVESAYKNNLIPNTIVGEDLTEYVDRSEFAAIAVQLYEELSETTTYYNDTPFNDIYGNPNSTFIKKAYALGITTGTSDITFEPYEDITRQDLATMLCRAIKKYSFDDWTLETDSHYYLDTSGVSKFDDDDEISDYAKPSVYYMAKFGIIKGVDSSHFAPQNTSYWQEATGYATATKEQAILMSLRTFNIAEITNFN